MLSVVFFTFFLKRHWIQALFTLLLICIRPLLTKIAEYFPLPDQISRIFFTKTSYWKILLPHWHLISILQLSRWTLSVFWITLSILVQCWLLLFLLCFKENHAHKNRILWCFAVPNEVTFNSRQTEIKNEGRIYLLLSTC